MILTENSKTSNRVNEAGSTDKLTTSYRFLFLRICHDTHAHLIE